MSLGKLGKLLLVGSFCALFFPATTRAGLVHHWRLDEQGGLQAADSAGGADASLVGFENDDDAQWVEGSFDGALDLGADFTLNNYVAASVQGLDASVTGGFTICMWVNPGDAILIPAEYQLVSTQFDEVGFTIMNTVADGSIVHDKVLLFWDGSLRDLHVGSTSLQPGTWYHVAITSTGIGGEKKYFVDGVEEEQRLFMPSQGGTQGVHPGSRNGWSAGSLNIGATGTGARAHDSVIDDVRIYDEALTAEQLTEIIENPPASPPTITLLTPTPGDGFHDEAQGIQFEVAAPAGATVEVAGIRLLLNGEDVTAGLVVGGTGALREAEYPALVAETAYQAEIEATASNGEVARRTFSFATLTPNEDPTLLHHFRMDETAGLLATDHGSGRTATLVNFEANDDAQWVAGKAGGALDLGADATWNNYAQFDAVAVDTFATGGFTVALWLKPGTQILTPGEHQLLATPGDAVGFTIMNTVVEGIAHDRVLLFWDGSLPNLHVGTTTLETGNWYHVAITSEGPGGEKRYYLNGLLEEQRLYQPSLGGTEGFHPATAAGWAAGVAEIGAIGAAGRAHDSVIDDVRIYNVALSEGDLQEIVGTEPAEPLVLDSTEPSDGDLYHPAGLGFQFVVTTPNVGATIPTENIHLQLGADDVTGSLTFAGTPTARQATYAGLEANTSYEARIEATDSKGGGLTARVSFGTFTQPEPGLRHRWPMDETSELVAADIVLHRDAALVGFEANDDAQWVAGPVAGALNLGADATNDNSAEATLPAMDAARTGGFTVAMWVNPGEAIRTDGEYQLLATPGDTVGFTILNRTVEGTFHDRVLLFWDGSLQHLHVGTTSLEPGTWYHVAITSTGAGGEKRYYLDGAEETPRLYQPSAGGVEGVHTATANGWGAGLARIGAFDAAGGRAHGSILDDVRIYDQPLSADRIAEIATGEPPPTERFVRGDANADDSINITDGIFVLNYLFLGGEDPPCEDAADANDDGGLNITDGIFILNFLFLGGETPPPPQEACGPDPGTDEIGCGAFPPCP